MTINSIADSPLFRATCLYETFKSTPLGFIDAGASGGICPLVNSVASLVHCTSFEPDLEAYRSLLDRYSAASPFAGISIFNTAIAGNTGDQELYLTRSMVNSSLLRPNQAYARRYGIQGLTIERGCQVRTETLDKLVFADDNPQSQRLAEFIKLDCQGTEFHILQGAERTLAEQATVLYVEVEFSPMYQGQKLFPDIDLLLRNKGYTLYGLYPNYISGRRLNRREEHTEERIIWADALYFKDPVECGSSLSRRDLSVLLLGAILTGYYDYALELAERYFGPDGEAINRLVHWLAKGKREDLEKDASAMAGAVLEFPDKVFLHARKFIDRNSSNSNLDFIEIDQPTTGKGTTE